MPSDGRTTKRVAHRTTISVLVMLSTILTGCATGSEKDSVGVPQDGGPGGLQTGDSQPGPAGGGATLIYAHTDTELYSMDPTTKAVTDIGPFAGNNGSITDLAVDAAGHLFVNSTTEIYSAQLPAGGTGTVQVTLKTTLPSGSKFYALGFVPAGVLESGEAMIAGDGAGDLYFIDTTGPSATPLRLGSFGKWRTGDPAPGQAGDFWALSVDVVFYMSGSTPHGIATLRDCYQKSGTTSPTCDNTNDVLAEIDMTALANAYKTKTAATSLRKQILGGGTQHGRLFGIGAWEANVYAFSRNDTKSGEPAKLLQIDGTGAATELQSFPAITAGWSGAGVTSAATITVIQ
jgi:hypothetical protein